MQAKFIGDNMETCNMKLSLSDFFECLIGKREGIRPEEITPEWIVAKREELYWDARFPSDPDLAVLTRSEFATVIEIGALVFP